MIMAGEDRNEEGIQRWQRVTSHSRFSRTSQMAQPNNKDVEYKLYLPQKKKEKKVYQGEITIMNSCVPNSILSCKTKNDRNYIDKLTD